MNEREQQIAKNNEQDYESYGWEFHKIPLLYSAILTALFYAFIFIYFNMD